MRLPHLSLPSIRGMLYGCCVIVAVTCALAWTINVEVAAKYAFKLGVAPIERLLPSVVYNSFQSIALCDLSTVSTILPTMFFTFLAWGLARVRNHPEQPSPWW